MLIGERIRLRAIEREDIPTFVRWFNDPDVRRYLLMYAPMSTVEEEGWFETLPERRDDLIYAIEARIDASWVHIGNVGLHGIDWKNRTAVLGIVLGEKSYWNQGLGTDATHTALRFAFHELNLHRVELEVFEFNPRALRCYEKAGFRHEGTRREALFQAGQYHDLHLMGILRDDFSAGLQSEAASEA